MWRCLQHMLFGYVRPYMYMQLKVSWDNMACTAVVPMYSKYTHMHASSGNTAASRAYALPLRQQQFQSQLQWKGNLLILIQVIERGSVVTFLALGIINTRAWVSRQSDGSAYSAACTFSSTHGIQYWKYIAERMSLHTQVSGKHTHASNECNQSGGNSCEVYTLVT